MFIDIHTHAYRKKGPFMNFCTIDELLERYEEMGVDKCLILPIVSPEIYLPQSNEDILDMAEAHPGRVYAFCNIDPRALTNSPDAKLDTLLSYYKDRGCRGLGEVMPNMPLMHPMVQNLFRCAEKVGLPVTYDGSDVTEGDFGLYDDPGLPQLEHTLQRYPDLIIFGHGPVFWAEIARLDTVGSRGYVFRYDGDQVGRLPSGRVVEEGTVPRLMRLYPNLHCDLSDFTAYNAFARDEDYGARFMTEFQDRICFGTDLCFKDMPVDFPDMLLRWVREGRITQTVFDKVARTNAQRIFNIPD